MMEQRQHRQNGRIFVNDSAARQLWRGRPDLACNFWRDPLALNTVHHSLSCANRVMGGISDTYDIFLSTQY